MSAKFQLVLPDDLAHRLKSEAKRRGIPAAQLVRESVEEKLNANTAGGPPLAWLDEIAAKLAADGLNDTGLSSRVDEIVYGGEPHDNR